MFRAGFAVIEIVIQFLIPAAAIVLAGCNHRNRVLWLFVGTYYALLGLVLSLGDSSSILFLSWLMLSPLVNSFICIGVVQAFDSNTSNLA
ncbi:MAG: hypothetical protein GX589_09165 [Deltaproteobacteria bacterium]|nr:hypothetical protein [Deltaproteobacteria bacterium]